jgi:hypothetical protein
VAKSMKRMPFFFIQTQQHDDVDEAVQIERQAE